MKLMKLLLAVLVLMGVGLFVFAALSPVQIEQSEQTKSIDPGPFLNDDV